MTIHPNRLLFLVTTLFVWGAFFVLWYCYGKPIVGIDDANIYEVYMRNLAQGHGLVYQVGGERVEGFTSLLWVLIGAFFYGVFPAPELALILFSVLIVNVLVYYLNIRLNQFSKESGIQWHHIFFMLLLLLVPGYFDWTMFTIMETGLWSLVLSALSLRLSNVPFLTYQQENMDHWVTGILLGVMVLVRPESLLWGVLFLIIRTVLFYYRKNNWYNAIQKNIISFGWFSGVSMIIVIWRLYYFGYPFPNTYYAKVSANIWDNFQMGAMYLIDYFVHFNPILIPIYLCLMGWTYEVIATKEYQPTTISKLVLVLICLLNIVFPLLTGGDHFYLGRLLQPLIPLTYLLFTSLYFKLVTINLSAIPTRILHGIHGAVFLAIAMLSPNLFRFYRYALADPPLHNEFYLARHGRETGYRMSRFFEGETPLPVWGVACAGGIAFRYEGKTLDLLGLNNVAMAHASPVKPPDRPKNHASFDKEVFYAQQPDIMYPTMFIDGNMAVPGPFEQSDTFQNDFFARALGHIHADARFKSLYVPVVLTSERKGDRLYAYFRRQFVSGLDSNEYKIQYLEVRGER
ncbi:MAG: hypothetical protein LCH81_22610 [Bacteroidetes bacterium]|nr:hypothetical protein [Bacteroidota bacterium]